MVSMVERQIRSVIAYLKCKGAWLFPLCRDYARWHEPSYTWRQRQAMDKTVADLNIAHFKELLAVETDPAKRQTIERLLAEEEAKLALAQVNKAGTQGKT
jgi:hypothetical protein